MTRYALRFLPSDPYGRGGHTCAGEHTFAEAEEIRRGMPNGAHVEVVPVADPDG